MGLLSAAATSTDKGPGGHNYTELYERLFFPWKDEPITIFEIGIAGGGSLDDVAGVLPEGAHLRRRHPAEDAVRQRTGQDA